ncbi:hypothetical protein ACFE04_026551 [Oxalis oulophora]
MASRYHVRSISLPSRSHPTTIKVEEELNNFTTWAKLTSKNVCTSLSGIGDLHSCLDELLNMGSTQQIISNQEKLADEFLDQSVKILDICGLTRESLLQIKEQVHILQSAFRRRKGDHSRIENNITAYNCFRKKMKKQIKKMIPELKQMENIVAVPQILNLDDHTIAVIKVLREVNSITINFFQSLMAFLLAEAKPKKSRWSVVSKLIHKGSIKIEEEESCIPNELERVDCSLGKYSSKVEEFDLESMCERFEALETCIDGMEISMESLFRRLIKTRASFLNTLSQ